MVRKLIVLLDDKCNLTISQNGKGGHKMPVPELQERELRGVSKTFKINTMKNNIIISMLAALLSLHINAQPKKEVKDYLGIEGPILLQKNTFHLVWSSHPDPSLFKQEYLASGDAFPKYKSMITVDFVVTGSTVDQAVATKIRELEQLKKSNYNVNFEVISNPTTGEKIVDCLIGQTAANDLNSLIERDIFRFKAVNAKSGQAGIFLYAVSTRKYGPEIKPFLIKLKTDKQILVREVAKLPIPELNISAK